MSGDPSSDCNVRAPRNEIISCSALVDESVREYMLLNEACFEQKLVFCRHSILSLLLIQTVNRFMMRGFNGSLALGLLESRREDGYLSGL